MATTFALALARANSLRYLATADGAGPAAGTIPNDAGATPDLQTDTVAGPIKNMALARVNGYGALPAGVALTQANARSIFFGDGSSAGNANVPRAETTVVARTGVATWLVDANVDGGGDPVIVVTPSAITSTAYVDITVPGVIGS